jgi:monothiol glutaredoxin
MARPFLDDMHIHASIRERVARHNGSIVAEVQQAVASHAIVVVGMAQNPYPARVRKALAAASLSFHYLEYGSYFSQWRQRTALKMWTGWPTLPMVFVKGVLVGGHDDVVKLLASGELQKMLRA